MAQRESTPSLVPSILDRLLGQEVPTQSDLERSRARLLRQLRASLQRDLENLLNTRCRCGSYPKEMAELETSLVNYGIPDFTGASLGSAEGWQEFLGAIRGAIERFEPRLRNVAVIHLRDSQDPLDRVLRFRIEAVLSADDEAEPVAFLSTMEPSSGRFRVDDG
jgi:type VI secretion system protein ImpF